MEPRLSRRDFLRASAAAGALAASPLSPFEALAAGGSGGAAVGFGPIAPTPDETTGAPLLELPAGFRLVSGGWTGDPLEDGAPTPSNHDGIGCFRGRRGSLVLVRNHERGAGTPIPGSAPIYDPAAGGGTTHIAFDPFAGRFGGSWPSLAGTLRNCAGGITPWNSWVSCEEAIDGPSDGALEREHGFCFEVPAEGRASALPLRALGRFVHEAIAFEPDGSAAYLTEDSGNSGLYRFLPNARGRLDAGRLQMLALRDAPAADTARGIPIGVDLPVDWVDIGLPDPPGNRLAVQLNSVYQQGRTLGGARFVRGEGIWRVRNRFLFTATAGGAAGLGQIFSLDTRRQTLRLVYESQSALDLESPDNVTASPRGGAVLCEDGAGRDRLLGLTRGGDLFVLARGNALLTGERGFVGDYTSSELTGPCFSPPVRGAARWLFVHIQLPGITCAIAGPWESGGL